MAKKKIEKPKNSRKPANARKTLPTADAPKPKPKPTPPPPPQPPTEGEELKLLEILLLRLVSPLKALPVQTAEAVVYIRPEEIAYITTTKDRHILIVDREGQEWQRFDVLKKLFERLSSDPRFFMAHKSCIVNIFAVKTFRKNPVTKLNELSFGDKVKGTAPVAGGNLKELRARLEL